MIHDRLGRSVLHVANAIAELDAAGAAVYGDQQAIDSTTLLRKAMIHMACIFGEPEREMIRARVVAGLNRVREQDKKRLAVSPMIPAIVNTAPCVDYVDNFENAFYHIRSLANHTKE